MALSPTIRGYRNGHASRLQIIESATSVFADHGYVGGSLRRIADRAGFTEPGVLRHFGSKSELLHVVLEHWDTEVDALHHAPPTRGLDELLEAQRRLSESQYVQARRLFVVMTAEASSDTHPAHLFIRARMERQRREVTRILDAAVVKGELAPLADPDLVNASRLIVAVIEGLEQQGQLDETLDVGLLFRIYVSTALHPAR